MTKASAGLRERKKARTREHIAMTAMGLFREMGFDQVTVVEVAEAAEVAATTVFNYFPTKEDLFFDRQDEVVDHLSRVVRSRQFGQSFADACRIDMLTLIRTRDWMAGLGPGMANFYRLVDASPALRARSRMMADQSAVQLTATIAEELSSPGDDITAAITASVLTAIHIGLLGQARREILGGKTIDTIAPGLAASTNRAFDLLGGEIATLGNTRPATPASNRSPHGST